MGVVLLNNVNKVTENMSVRRTGEIASISVGEGLLGRVINILGEPIDGRGPIEGDRISLPLERKAPGVIFRQPVNQPLQSSISARTTRPASLFIVSMWLSVRKPRLWRLLFTHWRNTERLTIL